MGQKFISVDRERVFLMALSVADWVPEDHLAWTVLEAVGELDLSAFYVVYRADGHGRPAYEPSMMVSLLLYAYARGNRSSRQIERACVRTSPIGWWRRIWWRITRRSRTSVVAANASLDANRGYQQIAREILGEAAETDRREDELYGDARGDELPEHLRTREGRRKALREAKLERERERAARDQRDEDSAGQSVGVELDPGRFVTRNHGRRAWSREAARLLEARRTAQARPIARARAERLAESKRGLEEGHRVELEANAAYEAWRARGVAADGSRRMAPGTTKPYTPPELPQGKINTTDHDSRIMRTQGQPAIQGYNAQAAVDENHIVVAAEVTADSPDFGHLEPMVDATERELGRVGVGGPEVVVADAGYWHKRQIENTVSGGIQILVAPDSGWQGDNQARLKRRAL